jgi:arylsulfate sulfotransferase
MRASEHAAALALALLAGCGSATQVKPAPACLAGNVQYTENVLVAEFDVCSISPASTYVEFGPDTRYGLRTSAQDTSPDAATAFLVAGMRQNTTYHLRAVTTTPDGIAARGPDHTFTTGSVPAFRQPEVKVTHAPGAEPARGVELAALSPGADQRLGVAAFDPSGHLIWYYDFDFTLGIAQPIKLLPNGHFLLVLYLGGKVLATVREIDLAGRTVSQFTATDVDASLKAAGSRLVVDSLSHDFLSLTSGPRAGHLLLLGTDYQSFAKLPGYTGPIRVAGNDIVDLDAHHNAVWTWRAFDHLDVNRHPYLFPDWTHANALAYSPDDGNLLLSLRHQSWVIKIDYENGKGNGDVLWRLGYQGDFALTSGAPANWFFAQHDVSFLSPNSTGDIQLGLFDNGDDRVLDDSGTRCGSNGAAPCYSRTAIFDVNEDSRVASLNWAATLPYSHWGGVTQVLENSDVYTDITAPADNPDGARVEELTRQTPPRTVWTLDIGNQNSYRTTHLDSLYPGVKW